MMNGKTATIPTNLSLILLATAFLFSGGLLAGCGGGGGGGRGDDGGSTTTTGVSSGEIEGFGSIIVNGVKFNTDNATFVIQGDDNPSLSDLHEGMIVQVDGSFDDNGTTGTASVVTFDEALEGPIDSIATSPTGLVKVLSILGHDVIVENGVTVLDDTPPVTFGNLLVGQVLEVSGHMGDNGTIQATFIEKKTETLNTWLTAGNSFEITGTVSNLDPDASTFQINNLIIDYSNATPRNGTLADGALVEAKGTSFAGGVLTASDVEIKAGLGANIARVELEGLVANFDSPNLNEFTINGQRVNYAAATYRGGVKEDLANGVKVEVHGLVDAAGILQAVRVTFKEGVRIEGNVASVSTASLTLEGLGITIFVDSTLTRLDDLAGLGSLAAGNEMKVRARQAAGGLLIATRLERVDTQPADRTTLRGPVANISNPTFTILGVTVNTGTVDEFEIEDAPTNRAGFFGALKNGSIVEARADLPGLIWDKVEIELEDSN